MAETTEAKPKKKAPAAKSEGKSCTIDDCKRAYRAKGYCFFHYRKWRRGEIEGRSPRYDTCNKEGCRKKVLAHGMCEEHHGAWKASRKSAKLAAPGA
jgi:hypothetical protein